MKKLLHFLVTKISLPLSLNEILKSTNKTIITIITLIISVNVVSQTRLDSTIAKSKNELKGVLLDFDKKTSLPYANIVVLHKNTGTITNEKGQFSLNISSLNKKDTISFQYIGYETKNLTIKQLDSSESVFLKENTYNLNEIFVFSNDLNPASIVKKVLENKHSNYKTTSIKNQTFIRRRFISDIDKIDIKFKKSSFSQLNEKMIDLIERKLPRHSISYTDFLGDLYFSGIKSDSTQLKVDPIKMVSLKDKDLADVEQLESIFENLFSNTKEKEYWKIKSGIIGGKVQMNNDSDKARSDSLKSIDEREFKTDHYINSTNYLLKYSSFNNKKEWDFLHHTSRYEYTLVGGTIVNDEDVYVIDFVPKKSGKFKGRIYIGIKTFALVRADYEYAPGKTGTNIHLLGVGYSMNRFSGSISFDKKYDTYKLKYFSRKEGTSLSIDRKISLIKKKKRFLLDKELNEIKVGLKLSVREEYSVEILILDSKMISNKQFTDFKQKEFIKMIYVDQFDDQLWKGFSIIEPTKQMREYKKQEN